MLVLATTSMREAMEEQQLTRAFAWHLHVGMMSTPEHILSALEEDQRFTPQECRVIEQNLIQRRSVYFLCLLNVIALRFATFAVIDFSTILSGILKARTIA